jgi:hypothetical protein
MKKGVGSGRQRIEHHRQIVAHTCAPSNILEFAHTGGGAVIDRYTKITAETQKQIREAVVVFDEIRVAPEGNVSSIFSRRRARVRVGSLGGG